MYLLKTYGVINRFFCFLTVFAAMWVRVNILCTDAAKNTSIAGLR